jgi:hypothetical protein
VQTENVLFFGDRKKSYGWVFFCGFLTVFLPFCIMSLQEKSLQENLTDIFPLPVIAQLTLSYVGNSAVASGTPKAAPVLLDFRLPEPLTATQQASRLLREEIPQNPQVVERIGIFWSTTYLTPDVRARLKALLKHFHEDRTKRLLVPLISGHSYVSLRTLDWLVINFAKRHKLTVLSPEDGQLVNIYEDYRVTLRYWKRLLFDTFRRGPRLFLDMDGFTYSTTIGQLNFLYWAERKGILHFLVRNLTTIEKDMASRLAVCREEKKCTKRKRSELALPSTTKCQVLCIPMTLTFEA